MSESEWEIVGEQNKPQMAQQSAPQWELVSKSNQMPQNQESFMDALVRSPFRIVGDALGGLGQLAHNIPQYYEQAKTEVPGLWQTMKEHPNHLGWQGIAGANEMINKLAQAPLSLAQYGANRLNLLPQSVPNAISKIVPEDTTQAIHELFGEPKYPGEALYRGAIRNIPEIVGTKGALSYVNPLRYTDRALTKSVIKEGENQVLAHNKFYDRLWNKASNQGFNEVPYNKSLVGNEFNTIKKYYTPKQYSAVQKFISDPTLSNAQRAQSDVGHLIRNLEEKGRTTPLLDSERAVYDSLKSIETDIESNMFKNKKGELNKSLQDEYKAISKSYRENVVPYKYNKNIQAFKNQEITKKELVESLKKGEFAAKKGAEHPELYRSKKFRNALIGAGLIGGAYENWDVLSNLLSKTPETVYK